MDPSSEYRAGPDSDAAGVAAAAGVAQQPQVHARFFGGGGRGGGIQLHGGDIPGDGMPGGGGGGSGGGGGGSVGVGAGGAWDYSFHGGPRHFPYHASAHLGPPGGDGGSPGWGAGVPPPYRYAGGGPMGGARAPGGYEGGGGGVFGGGFVGRGGYPGRGQPYVMVPDGTAASDAVVGAAMQPSAWAARAPPPPGGGQQQKPTPGSSPALGAPRAGSGYGPSPLTARLGIGSTLTGAVAVGGCPATASAASAVESDRGSLGAAGRAGGGGGAAGPSAGDGAREGALGGASGGGTPSESELGSCNWADLMDMIKDPQSDPGMSSAIADALLQGNDSPDNAGATVAAPRSGGGSGSGEPAQSWAAESGAAGAGGRSLPRGPANGGGPFSYPTFAGMPGLEEGLVGWYTTQLQASSGHYAFQPEPEAPRGVGGGGPWAAQQKQQQKEQEEEERQERQEHQQEEEKQHRQQKGGVPGAGGGDKAECGPTPPMVTPSTSEAEMLEQRMLGAVRGH